MSSINSRRSLGKDTGFVLYMFEEDLQMIEKWALNPSSKKLKSDGKLFGLWTNGLNPVVHLILSDDHLAEDYHFLKFKDEAANSMFIHIGFWSFEKPKEHYYQNFSSTQTRRRLVFLEVKKNYDNHFDYMPVLLAKGQKTYGKIESLRGQNPFRLPDEPNIPPTEEENAEIGWVKAIVASVHSVCTMFGKEEKSNEIEMDNTNQSVTYASVAKKGNQVYDQSKAPGPPARDSCQMPTGNNTLLHSQDKSQDISTCTKLNQWYVNDWGQKFLQEISSKLEEVISNKPKISRDKDTHNIMILFLFGEENYVISFPPNFPKLHAELYSQSNIRSRYRSSKLNARDPIQLVQNIIEIITSSDHR